MSNTNKQLIRITIGIILGIVISVIVSTILITVGYSFTNMDKLESYTVKFINVPIFYIKESGKKGIPVPSNMMMLGIVWSVITVFAIETLHYFREKSKEKRA